MQCTVIHKNLIKANPLISYLSSLTSYLSDLAHHESLYLYGK